MKTIYYITRTIPGGGTGGALIRQGSVKYLRELGYNVIVVALSDISKYSNEQILIKGGRSRVATRFNMLLFNIGIYDDYLQPWSKRAFSFLKNKVQKDDLVLATSGGEIGTLMLAKELKNHLGCRIVYNLHDPIDFTTIDGEFSFISGIKMRARDNVECELFHSADAIVTSSQYYADALKRKYPKLSHIISCHHFGYIEKYDVKVSKIQDRPTVNIVYGGNMGPLQGPEILIELAKVFPNVRFTFVGNLIYKKEIPVNVTIKSKMPYSEYIEYLSENATIGFFSLVGNVSKLCVPSKLYEYINVGIPILAAIDGDSKNIINEKGLGIATDYSVDSLKEALNYLLMPGVLQQMKETVIRERDSWYMKHTINELVQTF